MKLSEPEKRILRVVQTDGRMSNVDLAREVGLSESPCLRRLRALEDAGVVTGYRAKVDARKVGFAISAYVLVNLDQRAETDAEEFFDAVRREPRIVECAGITGSHDCILKVVARDIDDFADLTMRRILRLPSVKDISSSIVIKEIKADSGLPI